MKSSVVMAGVVVLIVGFAIAGYGLATPGKQTNTSTTTATVAAVRNTNRVVAANGFWAMGAANLSQGQTVTGTVSVSNFSAAKGHVFLYVLNESSFIGWGACVPCSATNYLNKSLPTAGTYSFTWTTPASGSYYFVLDDNYYSAAAPATFVANAAGATTFTTTQTNPNSTLDYGGVAVAVLGAVILGVGLVAGSPDKKQPPT
ncbi:MAG: hypothetical protein OK422_05095 [Thaumarchaeota archaeon]|nr:hypothetical protein [Nitrososphaerota archaeon]